MKIHCLFLVGLFCVLNRKRASRRFGQSIQVANLKRCQRRFDNRHGRDSMLENSRKFPKTEQPYIGQARLTLRQRLFGTGSDVRIIALTQAVRRDFSTRMN